MKIDPQTGLIELTEPNEIFVFGSNLAGMHAGGAAKFALDNYGAKLGQGLGSQGRAYALPTKDEHVRTLDLRWVNYYVVNFLIDAYIYCERTFIVTPIGCGLAGYAPEQIAPMFLNAPPNVVLPPEFESIVQQLKKVLSSNDKPIKSE